MLQCVLIVLALYLCIASSLQFRDISYEEINSRLSALQGDFAVVAPATEMLAVNVCTVNRIIYTHNVLRQTVSVHLS